MAEQLPAGPPNRVRLALLLWCAIWPMLTVLLLVLNPIIGSAPLVLRTGVATAILVPTIVIWVMPFIMGKFANWLATPTTVNS